MRRAWTVAIILLAGLPQGRAQVGGTDAGSPDRARLIDGVREVAAPGAPGSLVVFAPTASPIVAGGSGGGSEVAVIAAAHLGRGRVVAFAHDGYFAEVNYKVADTDKLLWNSLRWAAADKPKPRVGLIDGPELRGLVEAHGGTADRTTLEANLKGFDVLALTPYRVTPAEVKRARAFVESGGGLVAAATGWGWQQGSKKSMAEFPGNLLVTGSGLAWTDGLARRTSSAGYKVSSHISSFVNAARALELTEADREVNPNELSNALESIRLTLRTVPASEAQIREKTNKLLKGLRGLDLVPTHRKPVNAKDPFKRFAVGLETAIAHDSSPREVRALAAANNFPGAVPSQAPRAEHAVTIDTSVPGWHSLGLYAAPGDRVTVTVGTTVLPLKLSVQIGCHTDQLWHLYSWERIPEVVRRFSIAEPHTTAANALGGLVYIDVPDRAPFQKVVVTISGVVEAPFYQLGVTTADEWKTNLRRRPGPWAELAGRNVIFTVPSSLVRELDDPKSILTLWDPRSRQAGETD